ncbi:unnamed protein product [Rotaria magnacalcarata]|uniref:F-box domain-containing protein n=1 Tax=Rotaria magnacalcarata TaxID=392030 RepID=A0A816YU31_9BILA|nr:unnamed protein product [Rotaria magnacalcarata]
MTNVSLLDLPVEILHFILDHLDTPTIFRSLRSASRQLYAIANAFDQFELDLSSVVKCHLEFISDLIRTEHITSLIFSFVNNEGSVNADLILSIFSTRLRSLTLLEINKVELLDLLLQHVNLMSLVSFSVQLHNVYGTVTLPLLSTVIAQSKMRKLCLIGFNYMKTVLSWPTHCALQQLKIGCCTFQEYNFILEHCPLLKTFEMQNCTMYHINNSTHVTSSAGAYFSGLVSLTMNNCYLSFGELDFLLSLTPSLIHFKLINVGWNSNSLFDGFRWEKFIQKRLPFLNKFDFCFRSTFRNYSEFHSLHSIINSYRTPFWLERKHWYVTCDYTISASSSQVILYTKPVNIDNCQILIRCQVLSTDVLLNCPHTLTSFIELNLENSNKGSYDIPYLVCALKHNTTIAALDLNRNYIGSEGILHFADVLRNNIPLTTLNLEKNQIGYEGMQYLADALCTNTVIAIIFSSDSYIIHFFLWALTTLSIGGNCIGPERTLTKLHIGGNHIELQGIQRLTNALEKNTTLTILDLQDNQIGDEGIEYFCNSLKNTLTLTSLDLSSNQIEAPGARYMADLLENNSILDTLSLRDNELRSRGIEYLAYALKTNITLTTLNLRFNYIDDDGIESLADTLRANKTLTTLNLRFNYIDDDGIESLADTLRANKTLTTLNLSNNQITRVGARYLADALQKNIAVTILDLARNQIGMMGAKHLTNMLQTNSTLMMLNLWGNRIKDKGAGYLASALETNKTLTVLDIGSNHIGDDGAEYLAHALQTNRTLSTLNLQHNSVTTNLIQHINELIKNNLSDDS